MSLLTSRGQQAFDSATAKNIDMKKVYIRLKDGESVRVRLLGITDSTVGEYKAHGDYQKGIYTSPCIEPMGVECPYCVALNSGVEGWENFYPRKRYLILFADIDSQSIRVWDCSKQQGEAMLKLMNDYASAIDTMAFHFKRTGAGASDTSYNLIPILNLDEAGKTKFEDSKKLEVPATFFDQVLKPKTVEQMIANLKQAGFPVDDFFSGVTTNIDTKTEEDIEDISDSDIENM